MAKINPQVFMLNTASKALEYQDERKNASIEEIMRQIILSIGSEKKDLQIFGIAAANEILKMKRAFAQLSDKELLQRLTNNIPRIIEGIEAE